MLLLLRAEMASTRAPSKPRRQNSAVAALRIDSFVLTGLRRRTGAGGPAAESASGLAEATREERASRRDTSGHQTGRKAVAMGRDGARRGEPDVVASARDVAQRGPQIPQAVRLADDVGVERDAHDERPARGLLEHLVEMGGDHGGEVLGRVLAR